VKDKEKMSHETLLNEYKEDVKILIFDDEDHLDKIRRKGKMIIKNISGEDSSDYRDFKSIGFHVNYHPADNDSKIRKWNEGQQKIINLIDTMIEELSLFGKQSEEVKSEKEVLTEMSKKVFIVHGHDDTAKISLARFLEKLELEPIILHEQPNNGKTIIEKFEKHAAASSYSIVLLTPDDIGYPQKKEKEAKSRARQNVIFELGYFCGALERKNVSVLYKEGVEIPNDYLGVIYTPMDDRGAWQIDLAKEMKEAGLQFDMNKAFS